MAMIPVQYAYMVHATTVGFLALKIGGYVLVFPFFPPVSP